MALEALTELATLADYLHKPDDYVEKKALKLVEKLHDLSLEDSGVDQELSDNPLDVVPLITKAALVFSDCIPACWDIMERIKYRCKYPKELFLGLMASKVQFQSNGLLFEKPEVYYFLIHSIIQVTGQIHRKISVFFIDALDATFEFFSWYVQIDYEDATDKFAESLRDMEGIIENARFGKSDKSDGDVESEEVREIISYFVEITLKAAGEMLIFDLNLQNAQKKFEDDLQSMQKNFKSRLMNFFSTVDGLFQSTAKITAPIIRFQEQMKLTHDKNRENENLQSTGYIAAICCAKLSRFKINTRLDVCKGMHIPANDACTHGSTDILIEDEVMELNEIIHILSDLAAEYESVPLGLAPLVISKLTIREWASSCGTEIAWTPVLKYLLESVAFIMTTHPVETLRICAYELLQSIWDTMDFGIRFESLKYMASKPNQGSDYPILSSGAVVALQRLRLELVAAVDNVDCSPYNKKEILEIALTWIYKNDFMTVKLFRDSIAQNADIISAACSILRLILLRELSQTEGEQQRYSSEPKSDILTLYGCIPLENLIEDYLYPLKNNASNYISSNGLVLEAVNSNETVASEKEILLAIMRMLDVVDASIDAGNQLLKEHN